MSIGNRATIATASFRIQQWRKTSRRNLSGLFLARGCPVCDRPSTHIFCIDCQRQLSQARITPQQILQQPLLPPDIPLKAIATPTETPLPVIALGHYSGTLKRAILALKYGDRPDVARPLGFALSQQWAALPQIEPQQQRPPTANICAVPIPLHAERQRSRGFNQAELIARAFCQASRLPLRANGLVRTQATQPQHALGLAERQQNLSEVFQVGPSLQQQMRVLLIDDIYTTGATAQSAAVTLQQQGIAVIGIAVIAQALL